MDDTITPVAAYRYALYRAIEHAGQAARVAHSDDAVARHTAIAGTYASIARVAAEAPAAAEDEEDPGLEEIAAAASAA